MLNVDLVKDVTARSVETCRECGEFMICTYHANVILAIDALESDAQRLMDLAKWLARPWAGNDPFFAEVDPLSGQRLEGNVELRTSWFEFIRGVEAPVYVDPYAGAIVVEAR